MTTVTMINSVVITQSSQSQQIMDRPERELRKAMDILGDFNPSETKVMRTLGMKDDDIKLHQQIMLDRSLSCTKERLPVNKRHTIKALNTLGINYSNEKLMDIFGCDADTLCEADSQEREVLDMKIKSMRDSRVIMNKRACSKALTVLGENPSDIKIIKLLGTPVDVVVDQSQQQQQSIPTTTTTTQPPDTNDEQSSSSSQSTHTTEMDVEMEVKVTSDSTN
ncbi:hypothetical protein SAMD00019534_006780, partial [Acytostelium subglobosum LB1]|uniref:hypothetical protein n=1 Tax=Acytostelium subglobosum LB1 TaxID=1410327 RepID=UPI0006448C35